MCVCTCVCMYDFMDFWLFLFSFAQRFFSSHFIYFLVYGVVW